MLPAYDPHKHPPPVCYVQPPPHTVVMVADVSAAHHTVEVATQGTTNTRDTKAPTRSGPTIFSLMRAHRLSRQIQHMHRTSSYASISSDDLDAKYAAASGALDKHGHDDVEHTTTQKDAGNMV